MSPLRESEQTSAREGYKQIRKTESREGPLQARVRKTLRKITGKQTKKKKKRDEKRRRRKREE